jgi:glyoxylase-like metal-dependent hydrolase (beta-lactamase superfamily II)
MTTVGDINLHLMSDCLTLIDGGGPFGLVPRTLWSRVVPPVQDNLVPQTLHCLLVQTDGKNILIDTGYGHTDDDKFERIFHMTRERGDVVDALARLGVAPGDVDIVINTHLHYDHCGGNVMVDTDGTPHAAFPNAEYVVQRREYEDAMRPNERTRASYLPKNYQPLVESGQMRLLDGDTDIVPGVRCVTTPGHTPGHMSVVIKSGGQTALYACDLASFAIHFEKLGWMTAFDVEPLVTLETKRHWRQWAYENEALVIFPHDAGCPAGRLTDQDGKLRLEPVAIEYA